MGEPISIILNAAALVNLAAAIGYAVIAIDDFRRIKPGDEIKELCSEAESFGASCKLVGAQLERIHNNPASQALLKHNAHSFRELLLDRCNDEIDACSSTVAKLEKLIRHMDRIRKGWSKLEGVMKRASLLWLAGDVDILRERIGSHMNFLRMVLVTCNIIATLVTPFETTQLITCQIDELRKVGGQVKTSKSERSQKIEDGEDEEGMEKIHTEKMAHCVNEVISTATTLYEESVAGSTMDGPTSKAVAETVPNWLKGMGNTTMSPPSLSASKSIARKPLPTAQTKNRQASDPNLAYGLASPSTSSIIGSNPSVFSRSGSSQTTFTEPSLSKVPSLTRKQRGQDSTFPTLPDDEDADFSDEDNIDVELAERALSAGHKAFSDGRFAAARPLLLDATALLSRLSLNRRRSLANEWDVQYELAICSFSLDDRSQAENILLETIQQVPSSSNKHQIKAFELSHLLAHVYASTSKFELARQSCYNAINGRMKLEGKQSKSYYSSLALMCTIYLIQSMIGEARRYLEIIPASEQQTYLLPFKALLASTYGAKDWTSLIEQLQSDGGVEVPLTDLAGNNAGQANKHGSSSTDAPLTSKIPETDTSSSTVAIPVGDRNDLTRWPTAPSLPARPRPSTPQLQPRSKSDAGTLVLHQKGREMTSNPTLQIPITHPAASTPLRPNTPMTAGPAGGRLTPTSARPSYSTSARLSRTPSPGFPQGWEKGATPEGQPYYVDHESQTTTWTRPKDQNQVLDQPLTAVLTGGSAPSDVTANESQRSTWLNELQLIPSGEIQMSIARNQSLKAVQLITSGVKDTLSARGLTALHLAVLFGERSLARALLKGGSNVNAECEINPAYLASSVKRMKPIHLAAATHHRDLVQMLIQNGGYIRDVGRKSSLPLFMMHSKWLQLMDCKHPANMISTFRSLQSLGLRASEQLPNGRSASYIAQSIESTPNCGTRFWSQVTDYLLSEGR